MAEPASTRWLRSSRAAGLIQTGCEAGPADRAHEPRVTLGEGEAAPGAGAAAWAAASSGGRQPLTRRFMPGGRPGRLGGGPRAAAGGVNAWMLQQAGQAPSLLGREPRAASTRSPRGTGREGRPTDRS